MLPLFYFGPRRGGFGAALRWELLLRACCRGPFVGGALHAQPECGKGGDMLLTALTLPAWA